MILFTTCWHRNFITLALVCMSWHRSVARLNERNEPSTESTPRVTTNSTAGPTTAPEETDLELEQPQKTSGDLNEY